MPNDGITAKFPAATVALTDFGGSHPPLSAPTTLVLNTSLIAGDTSVVSTTTIPASWPATGWITIDAEIMKYASFTGSTFTVTRAQQQTTAVSHTAGANIGLWVTPQELNQVEAEIISLETQALGGIHNPNLVLNSDFGRRTVFGLAMPEVFADTSGMTAVDGAVGAVAGNVLTAGTNGTWSVKWCGSNATFYRDGTWSALVKQNGTGTTNVGRIGYGKGDGTSWTAGNGVYATYYRTALNTVTLELIKVVAGVTTVVASQAGVTWADGRVGWAELTAQGTTYIARFYDQGSGTPGVKSSATRLDTTTISGTIADAGVVSGQPMAVNGSGVGVATVWGGIATGNGGVYVETWLPESWAVANVGTLGGWAIGFDESADAGPVGKQWAVRTYIPATDRRFQLTLNTPDGSLAPSAAYTFSMYMKSSGATGTLIGANALLTNSALTSQQSGLVTDLQSASWARQTVTLSGAAGVRRAQIVIDINGAAGAKTGTAYFMLPQLEAGSAATAWRNAPADDGASLVWNPSSSAPASGTIVTTSAAYVEMDSSYFAINIFLPYDAVVTTTVTMGLRHNVANALIDMGWFVDGSLSGREMEVAWAIANNQDTKALTAIHRLAAGKHRIALNWKTAAATATAFYSLASVVITATRGR